MTVMMPRSEMRQQVTLAEKELARLRDLLGELRPEEPRRRGVIRFTKYEGGYSCAAIRVEDGSLGYWYVTQACASVPPQTWESLLDWIGKDSWDTIEVLS